MNSSISDLPILTAIDVVLRDVGYSNPMPDWFVPKRIDYSARKKAIEGKIEQYLADNSPQKPFEVLVPRKRKGVKAKWLQPSINDTMILQACVSALAPRINEKFDRKRVFSYRYNTDQDSLQLVEDQCAANEDYLRETSQQAASCTHVMLMDLEQAFASINRARFWNYLNQFSNGIELPILKALIDGFAPSGTGIPLVNDSVLFLGNAYLSVVDQLIAKHTRDFRRFMDDYCIFGASRSDLESLYKDMNAALRNEGFKINELKLDIVTAESYCDQFSRARAGLRQNLSTENGGDRYSSVPSDVDPSVMVTSLASTVKEPDRYLNDGTGRFQLAALRKLRNSLPDEARGKFVKDLTNSSEILQSSIGLLKRYMHNSEETWRSVWLLYLMTGIDFTAIHDASLRTGVQHALDAAQHSAGVPEVVRLWAKSRPVERPDALFEALSDTDYTEAGRRFFGG